MPGLLRDLAGMECCCEVPPLLDECPPNADGCPQTLSMSMVDHVVQFGICVYSRSFSIPVLDVFSPAAPTWNVAGAFPVDGCTGFGTWSSVLVSGGAACNDVFSGFVCVSPGAICTGCSTELLASAIQCFDSGVPEWRATFQVTGTLLVWTSPLTVCPSVGPWTQLPTGTNVLSPGTLTVS